MSKWIAAKGVIKAMKKHQGDEKTRVARADNKIF
jgi:hypothetical protein